jgi:type II secretory pathway component PulC
MNQSKGESLVTYFFIACSVITLFLMIIQYVIGSDYRKELIEKLSISKSTGFTMQEIPDYQFSQESINGFDDIVQRPLFFKVRKPITPQVEDETTEVSIASEELDFILTGVINVPSGIYCLLQNPRAKDKKDKFLRLEQGEEVDGWTINEIHPDRIVVGADGKREEIKLAKPRLRKPVKASLAKRKNRSPRIKPRKVTRNPFKQ